MDTRTGELFGDQLDAGAAIRKAAAANRGELAEISKEALERLSRREPDAILVHAKSVRQGDRIQVPAGPTVQPTVRTVTSVSQPHANTGMVTIGTEAITAWVVHGELLMQVLV